MDDQEKVDPVKPCMNIYKAKIQNDGSPDKFKFINIPGGDFQNKEIIGDIWYPKTSMRTLKYFLAGDYKHKSRLHQLNFIGEFLKSNVKHGAIVKLDIRYG